MNLMEQLERLDLKGRQAKVYLALLQLGSASAIEIAKYTKLKHPTVYDVLDLLREKQLVCETVSGRRRLFSPEDPARLAEIENRRKEALDAVLPDLYALYRGGEKRPRVHYYEGAEGGEALRSALLNVKAKEYFYFGAVREMLKLSTPECEAEYVRQRIRRGIWSWSIRNRAREMPEEEYMRPGEKNLRHVRYFPRAISDNISGLYLFDRTVAIASGLKENYTVFLESEELFILMKSLWQCMWEISEEP
ncbi:TrmB family transcriptional regulator [uncultured Victivallis sp.]|uniref:TrmB family transcriptional regulator n=1 Tax=Victivallis sp. TaxID=2049020 RepID=UPI0025D6E0A2|nr:helix-turn-helix domain-containing protein [uncultured Victivallis sp.]